MSNVYQGLALAAKHPSKVEFQRQLTDELLEGLQSREYVEVDEHERLHLTLKGVRCLLDYEGYDANGRKRRV